MMAAHVLLAALAGMAHTQLIWRTVSGVRPESAHGAWRRMFACASLRVVIVVVGLGPAFAHSPKAGLWAFVTFTACRWMAVAGTVWRSSRRTEWERV